MLHAFCGTPEEGGGCANVEEGEKEGRLRVEYPVCHTGGETQCYAPLATI